MFLDSLDVNHSVLLSSSSCCRSFAECCSWPIEDYGSLVSSSTSCTFMSKVTLRSCVQLNAGQLQQPCSPSLSFQSTAPFNKQPFSFRDMLFTSQFSLVLKYCIMSDFFTFLIHGIHIFLHYFRSTALMFFYNNCEVMSG